MLAAEQSHEFLDLYRRLGEALLRYLSRNIGGLILASLPLLALAGASSPSPTFFCMAAVGAAGAMIWRWRT
jgi:hypothetical protein